MNFPGFPIDLEFREVPGFPGYFAGSDGNFYSTRRGEPRALRGGISQPSRGNFYFTHSLPRHDGGQRTHFRHVLIAAAFYGPRPAGAVVDHINGDGLDNRPANLHYCSPSENSTNPNSKPNAGRQRKAKKSETGFGWLDSEIENQKTWRARLLEEVPS